MAHKKKSTKQYSDDEQVMVSRGELDKLLELAKQRAEQTDELDDDEFIDDFEENISDMGDSIDEKDDRRWELDENPIIDRIRHELRRELLNSNGKWYRPADIQPVVNRTGEHDILGFLRSSLTKNLAMGNISRTEANTLTRNLIDSFIWMMARNYRKWELDKSYMSWLVDMLRIHVYTHLTRPINEGERKYRGGSLANRDMFDDDMFNRRDPFMQGVDGKHRRNDDFAKDSEVLNI